MGRPVVRWQVITPSPQEHAEFYQELFGWEIDADNPLTYRTARTGAGGFDGGFWPSPPGVTAFVQLFVQVDDVEAAVARATELGGEVVVPTQQLPDGEVMAIVRDRQGLTFGLVSLAAGQPE